ncbi:hypothetical protein GCM10011376_38080 [Nocardioides flavus (ex Wang et al. 2016)]|uniref:EfeO-type cupredoxin-like domain-containing protein n=1 Tax=Nocardioides flavus (ex Wang et al. 2016) TaxID=2058780 RepID=A0ABQ3HND4_9ACTN|nr:cupredoxin domain-containing protein [Nocardioides flavus (ex Wang et al. 2016)]GHE19198.1 hypothetical protein GCM10011376_38080 [Nocardioides flavus (ex Wang et al. 2016)]
MSVQDWLVVGAAAALTALLGWYFFGPKSSRRADLSDGVQVATVTVKGGYSPSLVEVQAGTPVRLLFDRQESGDCSSRVVFADFKINQTLPAYATTAVEFTPTEPGEFEFACGMNMLHGRLRVAAASSATSPSADPLGVTAVLVRSDPTADSVEPAVSTVGPATSATGVPRAGDGSVGSMHGSSTQPESEGDAEERERAAEITDLRRAGWSSVRFSLFQCSWR